VASATPDLGFYYDGVPTRHPFPLTLGHEVSGNWSRPATGPVSGKARRSSYPPSSRAASARRAVTATAGSARNRVFPGSDVHGGFATHLVVPARGLCPVPELSDTAVNPGGIELPLLSVIADAVSTPYQAIDLSGLEAGDMAVFVGVGGVGGFGVQVAAAMGARVVAIDVRDDRLEMIAEHGAELTLRVDQMGFKDLRKAVRVSRKSTRSPRGARRSSRRRAPTQASPRLSV